MKTLKNNRIKTFCFISPVIPELINIKLLISKTKNFADYYIVEMMNLKAAGGEFKKILRENYLRSYQILVDETQFNEFIDKTKKILLDSNVSVPQFVVHYPKFEVVNLDKHQ